MKKTVTVFKDLPFEVEKTYKTKCQVSENFLVKELVWHPSGSHVVSFKGIYENLPHLGLCPLNVDRLVPIKEIHHFMDVCGKCGEEIN